MSVATIAIIMSHSKIRKNGLRLGFSLNIPFFISFSLHVSSSNNSAIFVNFYSVAISYAVLLLLSVAYLSAPLTISLCMTFVLPDVTARCSGVIPPSLSLMSISISHVVRKFTAFSDPRNAAQCNAVDPLESVRFKSNPSSFR